MMRGSCLCGAVGFEIRGPAVHTGHCHCSMCRKWSGSAFLSYLGARLQDVAWTRGEGVLGRYRSSPGFERLFCTSCGSSLAAWPTDPGAELTWLMMGTLDDAAGARPDKHIFVESKADWFEITDTLARHAAFPN
jgi:hypothetical protein